MTIDLTMLGRSIERLQQEVRDIRGEQTSLRAELAGLRTHLSAHLTALQVSHETSIAQTNERIDQLAAAMDARFETTHQQMATNLEIVLGKIGALETGQQETARGLEAVLAEIRSLKRD